VRIQIPDTDLSICPIGLGTVNAGIGWEGRAADDIFNAYVDGGGNLIDTARVYAHGRSEEVVGEWLERSGRRDEVVIVTKGGHPKFDSPDDDLHISRMTDADMRGDIEISLRSLKTDVIDIYFYHRDNRNQTIEEEIETMERFRKEGKIRYYACSNWDTDRIVEADRYCKEHGYRGFVADQILYNAGMKYMNPLPDDTLVYLKGDLWDYHMANPGNLVMPYMGVASGFFYIYAAKGAEGVSKSPYFTPGNIEVAEKCLLLAKDHSCSLTNVLLGFFMNQPLQCAPLYGADSPEMIRDALSTFDVSFRAEDFAF